MKPLNPQQERFCQEYLIDLNATDAYVRAGYKVKSKDVAGVNAARLLADARVQARVAELQAARAGRTELSQDYVLLNLTQVVERCMQRAPVMVRHGREFVQLIDEEGRHVWRFDAMGSIGALRLLGQHLGMFKEIHELTGKDGEAIPIEVRDAQGTLRSRIGRLADRLTTGNDLTPARPHGNGRRSSSP